MCFKRTDRLTESEVHMLAYMRRQKKGRRKKEESKVKKVT